MVSTSFIKETHLTLNLPRAVSANEQTQASAPLDVIIDQQGFYRIDGRALIDTDRSTLENALNQLTEGDLSTPLTLTADAAAPYQAVVRVIDTAGAIGFTKINITTQPEAE